MRMFLLQLNKKKINLKSTTILTNNEFYGTFFHGFLKPYPTRTEKFCLEKGILEPGERHREIPSTDEISREYEKERCEGRKKESRDQSISCRSLTRPPNRDDLANSLVPLSRAAMDSCSSENGENGQKSALFASSAGNILNPIFPLP
ncbi:hypothetical protein NPIL_545771 [Nephila pilipes]|uniref:Uncharacterized protein n=1 Tax=Nephila pilipes TaxID=299642 RepID=A0A8X6IB74_NEPPI|nr:hypothetical protein NPIL_545771 [Nephila pilipes]